MTDSLIAGHYQRRVAAHPEREMSPGPPPARTLLDIFAATVSRCADLPAIHATAAHLTYGELYDAATALAEELRAAGVGPGDRVGVRVPSGSADLYVAILGILHAAAAYVPVDADDPPARAQLIWEASGACAVIESGLTIRTRSTPCRSGRELTADDDAWVIFTSGSTGRPKGVAVTHRAAAAFVDAEAGLWTVRPEDRVLAGLSVGFDASCEEMWLAWRNGAALVPAPREIVRSGAQLGAWLSARGVTVISTVPTLAAMWDERDLADVRLLILGGEACPEHLGWRLAADREVWNTYGPTEATVVSTAARIRPDQPITIGWALRGWEVAIIDQQGQPAALGEPGELVIAGVGLGRYLDLALDAAAYAPLRALGWERAYRTGDIVRETIDGLRFIGRRDDQIKLGGRRLELGEVEAQLNAVPGVRAAAAAVQKTEAGNPVLVGYVVGDVDGAEIRSQLADRLPHGIAPVVIGVDQLPMTGSGKVDRKALPWPPPEVESELGGTAAWLADRWREQLGPLPITLDSDFFELGGSSLAAAKLVSALREHYPAVAIADVYERRTLSELSLRLDQLGAVAGIGELEQAPVGRRWALLQLAGVFAVRVLATPQWLIGLLALNRLSGAGPQVAWGWLIAGWLLFASIPGRVLLMSLARRLLLGGLRPGRYPRHSGLALRIWLIERLAATWRLQGIEGTPWAVRYARLSGHRVGRRARLFALPPVAGLTVVGDDATVEADVDMEGWWIEGDELVVGEVTIGSGARIGRLSVLMPGASVGQDAEIEPGSVVSGTVPAGQRWAGSPARRVGEAGESWPSERARPPKRASLWKAMYAIALAAESVIALVAAVPDYLLLKMVLPGHWSAQGLVGETITLAPLFVITFMITYALLVAGIVRAVSALLRPGWHPEYGATRWALWLTDSLINATNGTLFPLYSSVFARPWLRLLGVDVGKRAEVSVVAGLNRLTKLGETSMAADAATFAIGRSRGGWAHVAPIEVGDRSFIGNGAIAEGSTTVGDGCLIGVLTNAPHETPDGTSWFGSPPLELPQRRDTIDESRTTNPPRRLIVARGATELVRIVLPSSLTVVVASLVVLAVERIGAAGGLAAMALATPLVFLAGGVCATLLTVALKWIVIGRYRTGEHPLWSFFVWRDEIINSCQERLAGPWLIASALATPLMSAYLRLMGSNVGRDVWCDTLTITEFDMVELGDRCVVNRHAVVEAHLFHDRMLRIGAVKLGPGATVGPTSAILPDTELGAGSSVGARSVVMRGEHLPPGTRWHGSPVVAA